MPPLTVIGSCRVYEPLLNSSIALDQSGVYGYTHNAREHLQMLYLAGTGSPCEETISEVTAIPVGFAGMAEPTIRERIFVVEVSSIRILEYMGWFLQINRFALFCEKLMGRKFRPDQFRSEERLKAVLSEFKRTWLDLGHLRYFEQSEAELAFDVARLNKLLGGRVLFVCHFNSDRWGAPIWQRTRIQSCLERLHRKEGLRFFDPTPHVIRRSPERALKDLGHYTPEFEREMTDVLAEQVHQLAA